MDGLSQRLLEAVSPPGIGAEGDVSGGQLVHVEHGTMAFLLEEDGDLAAAFRPGILEEDDSEGSATDTVAVMGEGDDLEIHGCLLLRFVGFVVLADELDPDPGDAAFVVEFRVDGVDTISVAGGDHDAQTGMAQVVAELLADGILVVFVEDVAEFVPALADGLGRLLLVQDVAGVADPAQAGVHADFADLLASDAVGIHSRFLSVGGGPVARPVDPDYFCSCTRTAMRPLRGTTSKRISKPLPSLCGKATPISVHFESLPSRSRIE